MQRLASIGVILVTFSVMACDDEEGVPPTVDGAVDSAVADAPVPDAALPDAPLPDAPLPDAAPPIGVGALCPTGTECMGGLLCLDDSINPGLPTDGYCSKMCTSDGECGGDSFCSPTPIGPSGSPRLCFQKCPSTGAADCAGAPGRVCGQMLNGMLDLGQSTCMPGDPTKTDGDACAGHLGDCNANQICLYNPFDFPAGMCLTFGCTVGDDTTCAPGGDGKCIDAGGMALCVDPCANQGECRSSDGYSCAPLGGLTYDVCYFLHQSVGSACVNDTDCGPATSPWRCVTGATFPGGYCGAALGTCDPMNESTCPFDSVCVDPTPTMTASGDEACLATCQMDSDCRTSDGYACVPLDALNPMSPKVCKQP